MSASSAAAGDCASILDESHLERMTLGDRRLEREVLQIFLRQSAIMLGRIAESEPGLAAAAAHTLVGSARGVGAWRVAQAAEHLNGAATSGRAPERREAIARLQAAVAEANTAIGARLRGGMEVAMAG